MSGRTIYARIRTGFFTDWYISNRPLGSGNVGSEAYRRPVFGDVIPGIGLARLTPKFPYGWDVDPDIAGA